MKSQFTPNFPRLGETMSSLFTLMPPISNSNRIEEDRPRRETRIVYTREDRRPADPRTGSIEREFGASAIGTPARWSAEEYLGCVSVATAPTGAEEACRRSVPSIRIRNAVVCQRARRPALPCTGPPPHISLSEHVREITEISVERNRGCRRERAVARTRVTHASPPRYGADYGAYTHVRADTS